MGGGGRRHDKEGAEWEEDEEDENHDVQEHEKDGEEYDQEYGKGRLRRRKGQGEDKGE